MPKEVLNLSGNPAVDLPLKVSEEEYTISPEKKRIPVRYLIFDLDGTLINIVLKHGEIFVDNVHEMLGVPKEIAWAHYMTVGGRRTTFQVDTLLDKLGLDIDSVIKIRNTNSGTKKRILSSELIDRTKSVIYEQKSKAKGEPFPEVAGMLRVLRSDGISLGISTFSKEADATEKLRQAGILDFFRIDSYPNSSSREYAIVGRDSLGLTTNLRKGQSHFELLAYIFSQPYYEFIKEAAFVSDTIEDHEETSFIKRHIGIADIAHTRAQLLRAGVNCVKDPSEYGQIPSIIKFL